MLEEILLCVVASLFSSPTSVSETSVGLRFSGETYFSHAEYDAWNWNANGTLQFFLKTSSQQNALVFYQDRKEDGDKVESQFMDLFLVPGGARFRARVGNEEQKCDIHGNFRDAAWHEVKVEAGEHVIWFSIDELFCKVTVNANYPSSKFNGKLFIGGIPYQSAGWSSPSIFYDVSGFQGCIGGLKYNRAPNGRLIHGRLQRSIEAENNCTGACANQLPHKKCHNGGRCIDNVVNFECNCLGTGYEGPRCAKASTIVYMDGKSGYISYKLSKQDPLWFTEINSIDFRFLPDADEGVFVYMGRAADHLLVELVNGSLRVQADFGGGAVEMYVNGISSSKNCWHFVQVRRRKTLLTVSVDRGRSGNATAEAHKNFTSLNLNNKSDVIYFGGGPSDELVFSKAKNRYYSGFLQQFRFENFQVLDEAFDKRKKFRRYGVERRVYDNPILRTAQKLCASDGVTSSGCPPNDDDIDSCNPATATSTSGSRSTEATSTFTEESSTEQRTSKPSKAVAPYRNDPTPRPKGVSAWLVIVIVLSAVALVLVSVFLLYRWNHRYTGSFKPSKNEDAPMQDTDHGGSGQQRSRMYEQPAFFVYKAPKKPQTAQSPPVSI